MEDPISIHSTTTTTSYPHYHQHHQHHHQQQPSQHPHPPTTQQKPFEFTRKKRWADTVVAEVVDIAILVFSQQGAILHCDAAVSHVLGYTEDQLLGSNFSSFLHEHDTSVFFDAFNDSVALHSDLTSYVRIKPNPASAHPSQNQRPRLFEVKASPYYNAQNTDCVCVFAMLAPYPTFNSRRLDAFLPLKAENHLLNDRLADLKRNDADDTADDSATSSDLEMLHDTRTGTPESHVAIASTTTYPFHHSSISAEYARSHHHHHAHPLKAPPPPPAHKVKLRGSTTLADGDDITETGSLKRKRRNDAQEGRVCTACGRNNSPEWRKGPQGPKTLCNACGLRWAKKAKKSPNAHEGFVNTAATAPAESV